jgi:hypothetical protein
MFLRATQANEFRQNQVPVSIVSDDSEAELSSLFSSNETIFSPLQTPIIISVKITPTEFPPDELRSQNLSRPSSKPPLAPRRNSPGSRSQTPIQISTSTVSNCAHKIIKPIPEKINSYKLDSNLISTEFISRLFYASEILNHSEIDLLLKTGVNPNTQEIKSGNTAAHKFLFVILKQKQNNNNNIYNFSCYRMITILHSFLSSKIDLNIKNNDGLSCFQLIAFIAEFEFPELKFKKFKDVDLLFFIAARLTHRPMVTLLLPIIFDKKKLSQENLIKLFQNANLPVIKEQLTKYPELINFIDKEGNTLLHINSHMLVKESADKDHKATEVIKNTFNRLEITYFLLQLGASISFLNYKEQAPFDKVIMYSKKLDHKITGQDAVVKLAQKFNHQPLIEFLSPPSYSIKQNKEKTDWNEIIIPNFIPVTEIIKEEEEDKDYIKVEKEVSSTIGPTESFYRTVNMIKNIGLNVIQNISEGNFS